MNPSIPPNPPHTPTAPRPTVQPQPATDTLQPANPSPNPRSIALIVGAWLVLHIGCLFTPGLLDDVDSVYIEIAREMLVRRDFVTPTIDGIRFFDKPPLMYWLSAASMSIFGPTDWAGRLPLALLTLALLLSVYALGLRLFREVSSPQHPDRAALYSTLALATAIGPYLYTRFFIPDIIVTLWLTLAIHAFLLALERLAEPGATHLDSEMWVRDPQDSALLPCLAFASVTALNVLTKGLIGLVFPVAFVILYLTVTRQLRVLRKFHLIPSTLVFLAIAAPWHILAALRNPAIALPPGLRLPAHGGWAWFYLYNEHVARFLSRRIPHDYGQVPVPLFWLLAAIWIFPWTAFLPGAIRHHWRALNNRVPHVLRGPIAQTMGSLPDQEAALTLLLWTGLVLGFFTLSARQEYYSLPALPALALMAGGLLAAADRSPLSGAPHLDSERWARHSALFWHRWLVPLCGLCALVAFFFAITAPHADTHTDIATLLAQGGAYNLSLGHLFDLTGRAMGLFRGPLIAVGLCMSVIGPASYALRRSGKSHTANLAMAVAAGGLLLCMHAGLVRFYPTLGSRDLAQAIVEAESHAACSPQSATCVSENQILIDGELTSGSTLLFYTRQPVHLVNGRINGPWYGSFWPDAPAIFETDESLRKLWGGPRRIFLLTYHPGERIPDLARFGTVHTLASSGGKSILTNR